MVEYQRLQRLSDRYALLMQDIGGKNRAIYTQLRADIESHKSLVGTTLSGMFYLIADNLIASQKFAYIDRDNALQDSVMLCLQKVSHFQAKKGACFNFFTSIIFNQLRQNYRTNKSYISLKLKAIEHLHNTQSCYYRNRRLIEGE